MKNNKIYQLILRIISVALAVTLTSCGVYSDSSGADVQWFGTPPLSFGN